jgi:hypothetical protein
MTGLASSVRNQCRIALEFLTGPAESFTLARWVFLRLLGLCSLIACVSLWVQHDGLIGAHGILPAGDWLRAVHAQTGPERWWLAPTLCWLNFSDAFRHGLLAAGTGAAALVLAGIAQRPALLVLWACYLSLATVSGVFLGYQWDALLLEATFLAVFLAPAGVRPRRPRDEPPPSRLALALMWWLVFRLMFMAGAVKLLSDDDLWWNLRALTVHYETQCLPAWLGWWAHQLPEWFQVASCAGMFLIELIAPFLLVCGRVARHAAALSFIGLMALIALTGNYGFFNLLTAALCVTLLDDAFLRRCAARLRRASHAAAVGAPAGTDSPVSTGTGGTSGRSSWRVRVEGGALLLAAALILWVSGVQTVARLFRVRSLPGWVLAPVNGTAPFRTINAYGLFAVMTRTRPEIIVEGSDDGRTWRAYEFKWKAGDVRRAPGYVAPHQPRLDWQMWFAALQDVRSNPWFLNFLVRLLQGQREVTALLATNPFGDRPPRFIRAQLYEYRFTDVATRRKSGEWWRREFKGAYCPPLSLPVPAAP